MNETQLVQSIRKYLSTVPKCFFWKEHGGQYGTAGIPDIIVCLNGHFIGLEAKVGKNEPTPLQSITLGRLRTAGATAEVVRSVDDVKAIIKQLEEKANGQES